MATSQKRFVLLGCSVVLALTGLAAVSEQAAVGQGDPVIYAAGDIACPPGYAKTATTCHQAETAQLIATAADVPAAVLPVGDEQYKCGAYDAFNSVYKPTWGQFDSLANPVVGDNEYTGNGCSTPGAAGYFTYFGDRATPRQLGCRSACQGYYSYDVGNNWHLVALNSECTQASVGGCAAADPMATWLKSDLAADRSPCTLAYMHRSYWGTRGKIAKMKPIVQTLYDAGVDILLVGHNHVYTRFEPQNPNSVYDPTNGLVQMTVGTGGRAHGSLSSLPNVAQQDNKTFGVLKLTLQPTSYNFAFVPDRTSGNFTDSGTATCHRSLSVQSRLGQ